MRGDWIGLVAGKRGMHDVIFAHKKDSEFSSRKIHKIHILLINVRNSFGKVVEKIGWGRLSSRRFEKSSLLIFIMFPLAVLASFRFVVLLLQLKLCFHSWQKTWRWQNWWTVLLLCCRKTLYQPTIKFPWFRTESTLQILSQLSILLFGLLTKLHARTTFKKCENYRPFLCI